MRPRRLHARHRYDSTFIVRATQISFILQFLLQIFGRDAGVIFDSTRPIILRPTRGLPQTQKISIFAAFMTDNGSTRASDLLEYVRESTIPPSLDFNSWLINWTTYNDTARHFLYPPDHYRSAMKLNRRQKRLHKDLDLSAKFFFSIRFFLENTTSSWFYRATDDTIVNFANLGPFMEHLESKHNPLNESVVVGNCIDLKQVSYLQGGVGILFSRVAASKIALQLEWFMKKLNRPEDVFFTNILTATDVSLFDATSEFFIGHDIYADHRHMFWNNTLDTLLPPCPEVTDIWTRSCRRFVVPLADLVFWHQEGRNKTLDQTIMFARWVFRQPRWINWWLNRGRPWLCISNNVTERAY
jgi:hypothetical protein